jgi:ferredoxin
VKLLDGQTVKLPNCLDCRPPTLTQQSNNPAIQQFRYFFDTKSDKRVLKLKLGEIAMKIKRKIINIDEALCNGCEQCIPSCQEQAIQMVDTPDGPKARLVKELYCDGLGACLGNCPTGALTIEEREAEAYDDAATIERIKEVAPEMLTTHQQHMAEHATEAAQHAVAQPAAPQGFVCPSARMLQFDKSEATSQTGEDTITAQPSELKQWPVQLHLVPPQAPYFKSADLYVVADCVPFAYGNFHQEFLKGNGKAIAVGCPKLDDTQAYLEKITQIIAVGKPKSITIVNMEVPCCFGLVRLVEMAAQQAGSDVPVKTVTISIRGERLN